ncbi:MAG: phosphate system positive regulatory protein pho81 [Chrysothrix sp. TS-e1954]|nr:MAG: phosphate system positive regulatory protein pho81 [Chrysothrix sp. TS-e1954]
MLVDLKFGKQLQKKQLEIPEYAAKFVDYKALKKLIKELKNSPVPKAKGATATSSDNDTQLALQANKAPFFFRLDRELDKVNKFYTDREEESKVRLRVLIDKQKSMRMRNPVMSRNSTQYMTLEQGFRDFIKDLNKLQQFIEINATAFSKILKKWDKTSKSQTKELYLSRAVEVQPCFNREVISELSDQAATSLLDCAAWTEGDGSSFHMSAGDQPMPTPRLEQDETDADLLEAANRGDLLLLRDLVGRLNGATHASDRLTKIFLSAVSQAPQDGLKMLLETNQIDMNWCDEINGRNSLHKAAMYGRSFFISAGLAGGVDPSVVDAYGRIPLHYACMNGHVEIIQDLIQAKPMTVDVQDLDNFTALVHAVVHGNLHCVEAMLAFSAQINPANDNDHVPLNLACQYGSLEIVDMLLHRNPKIVPDAEGLFPQHLVAKFGRDPRILIRLQDCGVDLDGPDKLYQWTPLLHAASEGRLQCLETLIQVGVDVGVKDEKGLQALYYATWEGHLDCMNLLASVPVTASEDKTKTAGSAAKWAVQMPSSAVSGDVEVIPDLSLPPPIIPTRRYGHNFLEDKTTVLLTFGEDGTMPVVFYDESKYPAGRLAVAPKSPSILPRNLLLPFQEDNRCVSFEIDSIDTFALDFEVFPTFGKKVIAKGSVPPEAFRAGSSSSGNFHLSLLDPRLRSVGQINFRYQVIKPFHGANYKTETFATYWKATSQLESKPSSLITGSSLTGDYMRITVQVSRDGVPIVWPHWTVDHSGLEVPTWGIDLKHFRRLGQRSDQTSMPPELLQAVQEANLAAVHEYLTRSFASLEESLDWLPTNVAVELHILYPSRDQERDIRLGPTANINDFVDSLLTVIFEHVNRARDQASGNKRSIVFTSANADICTALNWKQPNYPVLLCNDLGAKNESSSTTMSIKEAVRISQSNNLMGLICRSRLLDLVPPLISSIKVAGLVLASDASDVKDAPSRNTASPPLQGVLDGVDGILRRNGVLRFHESVEV